VVSSESVFGGKMAGLACKITIWGHDSECVKITLKDEDN
jgi:hypothetical protein